MGGSVRKDFSGRITHVVAYVAQGQKYKVIFVEKVVYSSHILGHIHIFLNNNGETSKIGAMRS